MKKTTEELDLFVRKKLRRGYPAGELKNELLAEGYPPELIESAFYKTISRLPHVKNDNPGKYPLWFFLSVGLLILGISLKAVKGLWLEPWAIPLIILGLTGIVLKFLLPNSKK